MWTFLNKRKMIEHMQHHSWYDADQGSGCPDCVEVDFVIRLTYFYFNQIVHMLVSVYYYVHSRTTQRYTLNYIRICNSEADNW